MILLELIHRDK